MTTEKLGPSEHPAKQEGGTTGSAEANVDPALQGALGRRLREAYQEVVDEEVPSKFLNLLNELKKKEAGGDQTS